MALSETQIPPSADSRPAFCGVDKGIDANTSNSSTILHFLRNLRISVYFVGENPGAVQHKQLLWNLAAEATVKYEATHRCTCQLGVFLGLCMSVICTCCHRYTDSLEEEDAAWIRSRAADKIGRVAKRLIKDGSWGSSRKGLNRSFTFSSSDGEQMVEREVSSGSKAQTSGELSEAGRLAAAKPTRSFSRRESLSLRERPTASDYSVAEYHAALKITRAWRFKAAKRRLGGVPAAL
eukprot:scaffold2562_cov354-Prasinococcus_capsulatus_cf.AAC.1